MGGLAGGVEFSKGFQDRSRMDSRLPTRFEMKVLRCAEVEGESVCFEYFEWVEASRGTPAHLSSPSIEICPTRLAS